MANNSNRQAKAQAEMPRQESASPVAEEQGTNETNTNREAATPPSDDLVTEGQENDPAVPAPLDKNGPANDIPAPGEAVAGEKKVQVRATSNRLVYDPYTLDAVGEKGGEMRLTAFVQEQLDNGALEEI